MTFFPVVERELRVASRRRGTYWGRCLAATLGAGLAGFILMTVHASKLEVSQAIFYLISILLFLYAMVAGVLVTCDCLSEEKREGTLGLLFLTDLKGVDVVLGKLAATSLNAFYGMLAVMPMLAVPFLIGGVTRAELLRVVLTSLNVLFLFLCLGIFVSACSRTDTRAQSWAGLLALVLVLFGPLASQVSWFPFRETALMSSPAYGCYLAFDVTYPEKLHNSPLPAFWVNVALVHLYAWIFFLLACWIVPRSWQDANLGKRIRRKEGLRSIRDALLRAQLLTINPYLWRTERFSRRKLVMWLVLGAVALVFVLMCFWLDGNIWEPPTGFFILLLLGLILKNWMAVDASRTLSEDRRGGGMELLLSTPLDQEEIVRGHRQALRRRFWLPACVLTIANLVFMIVGYDRLRSQEERAMLVGWHLNLGLFLPVDLIALSWVGMWQGMVRPKPNRAAQMALAAIVALPAVAFLLVIIPMSAAGGRSSPDTMIFSVLTLWFLVQLAADIIFGMAAANKLTNQFRVVVSEGVAGLRGAATAVAPTPTEPVGVP